MRPLAFYNEFDVYAGDWLRNLVEAGQIAPGEVDTRSIVDLRPADVAGYRQCHFFAGIAGWSLALRLAGWPDDREVWTGSCPCQPFSAAGRRAGMSDERHLWPVWFRLIRERRPSAIFGEQVDRAVRLGWLDAVFTDLEAEGYACAATVLGAHSVGAPHIRNRIIFVAYATEPGRSTQPIGAAGALRRPAEEPRRLRDARRLAEPAEPGSQGRLPAGQRPVAQRAPLERGRSAGFVAQPSGERLHREQASPERGGFAGAEVGRHADGLANADGIARRLPEHAGRSAPSQAAGGGEADFWSDLEWLPCRDGKARPAEPGTFPLAHGIPGRVGRLRAYGNAIVPQVAAAFIAAAMDSLPLHGEAVA